MVFAGDVKQTKGDLSIDITGPVLEKERRTAIDDL